MVRTKFLHVLLMGVRVVRTVPRAAVISFWVHFLLLGNTVPPVVLMARRAATCRITCGIALPVLVRPGVQIFGCRRIGLRFPRQRVGFAPGDPHSLSSARPFHKYPAHDSEQYMACRVPKRPLRLEHSVAPEGRAVRSEVRQCSLHGTLGLGDTVVAGLTWVGRMVTVLVMWVCAASGDVRQ